MKKIGKKASIVGLATTALLVTIALSLFLQYVPKSSLLVYAQSNPDSYGNYINQVGVLQSTDGGTTWDSIAVIHYTTYTSGMTIEIPANVLTRLNAFVWINKTLAATSDDAKANTRMYLNVSGVCTNQLLEYYMYVDEGPFWCVIYRQSPANAWTPTTDTTYQIDVKYEAYY